MLLGKTFEVFVQASPLSVMLRGTLERFLDAGSVDRLFETTAEVQYTRKLAFSQCVQIMSDVVFQTVPSINAWCQESATLECSRQAVYRKIGGIEPEVSAGLVRLIADKAQSTIATSRKSPKATPPKAILRGYRVRILDGNHLPGTEHRLGVLRDHRAAALPGQALVLYDPQDDLVTDVIPCEDAYAQERSLLPPVLELLQQKDCLLADRNFCTAEFLAKIDGLEAFFVIRQHGSMKCRLLGKRREAGKDGQGRRLVEQTMELTDPKNGRVVTLRRVTIFRKAGSEALHVLTNLPKRISSLRVAEMYRKRWRIEDALQRLQGTLNSEINTLAYPKAALFGFCLGCVAYNAVSVLKAAVAATHGEKKLQTLSMYYLTLEIARITPGMEIVLPDAAWTIFRRMDDATFAATLLDLAQRLKLRKYATHKRGPKKPPTRKISGERSRHVSTARLLNNRI